MNVITVKNAHFSYDKVPILKAINCTIAEGKITTLIGPNGSGKSTLLQLMARLLSPCDGDILFKSEPINGIDTKALAKELSVLIQEPTAPLEFDIFNLVKAGRYPHQGFFQSYSKDDEAIIDRALEITHLKDLKYTKLQKLSGGQKQRAFIAMVLAQDTDILLFDEPTNHLDIKHQLEILKLLKKLNKEDNRTIVLVLHDINLALRFSDNIIMLKDGEIKASGASCDVVTQELIYDVFGVKSLLGSSPITHHPHLYYS